MDAGRLEGSVALVTGAGGAIGGATAKLLASEGNLVTDNRLDAAEAVALEIQKNGGVAEPFELDVSDQTAAQLASGCC